MYQCLSGSVPTRPRSKIATIIRMWITLMVAGCALGSIGQGQAEAAPNATQVAGNITTNTTWTAANSPYEVTAYLQVLPGVTLTIEPGVQVFVAEHTHIDVDGTLIAEGTQAQPITFSGSTAQSGWWYGIQATYTEEQPATVSFNYVTVEHSGYANLYNGAALGVSYTNTTVRNSTFKNNGSHGLNAELHGPLILENTTFENTGLIPIRFGNGTFAPQVSNVSATGSGAVEVPGELGVNAVVYSAMSWEEGELRLNKTGLPYVFENGFNVRQGGHVILEPGIEVQVENAFSVAGELTAVGTADQPIRITALNKQPGGWWGLNVSGDFDASATALLEHVILEYGGRADSPSSGNLSVNTANVTVRNSVIQNGGQHGVYNSGGSPDDDFAVLIEDTSILNHAASALVCDDESCKQTLSNLTATGNALNYIVIRHSQNGDVVWTKTDLPYFIEGNAGIDRDGTMIIEPGVQVLMGEETTFNVYGKLYAVGTVEEPILFTGTTEQPGWWDSLWVHGEGLLELRHCNVGYGGSSMGGMIEIASNSAFVNNCQIHHSAGAGINLFTNVTPIISRNMIENNAAGLTNNNGTANPLTVDARLNWWGAASGPAHGSNPGGTGNSVSDLVLYAPWLTDPSQVNGGNELTVQVGGVGRYSPGETVQYAIAYGNPTSETVQNAVLRVALPANSTYVDSTGNGILWPQRNQIFWKLGNLAPGAGGLLAVRVTYAWGLPDGLKTAVVAQVAGSTVNPQLFNVAEYLDYSPRFETGVTEISADQVQTLRAGDPSMDAIYNQAEAGNYEFGSATERTYNTGEKLIQVSLLRVVNNDVEAFIIWRLPSGSVGVEIHSSTLTVYKPGQGLRFSLQTKLWEGVSADELVARQVNSAIGWSECMMNCIEDKLPGEVAEQLIKAYSVGKKAVGCIKAAGGDKDGILECSKIIDKVIPVYGLGVELVTCNQDCDECVASGGECSNDKCHCCTEDKYSCSADDWLYSRLGRDVIKIRKCGDNGIYLAETVHQVCPACEKCMAGGGAPVCTSPSSVAARVGWENLNVVDAGTMPARDELILVSGGSDSVCEECLRAKDPNEIRGPEGDLLPGQVVTYTLEYENVGNGVAFGVFIINPISEHFDLATLTVQDATVDYSVSTYARRIYFEVGDLEPTGQPGAKGLITYSLQLKTGLPSGTVIANDAVVYFPSVPEETPTNTAVNVIQPIAVPIQHFKINAGQPVNFTLNAEDVSGLPVTFQSVTSPRYGTLSGTSPTLTYTPNANFSGLDRLLYTASNGSSTSRLAEVVFEILPVSNGIAPTVKWVSPANGEVVNSSLQVALLDDGSLYTPHIQVQFSEPMAASTLNTTTVEITDSTGRVVPSSVEFDPTLDQIVLFMREPGVSGTTYTVTLKAGITDATGTALAANYVWNFKFGGTPNIYFPFLQR
jgi:hypothetical protein